MFPSCKSLLSKCGHFSRAKKGRFAFVSFIKITEKGKDRENLPKD